MSDDLYQDLLLDHAKNPKNMKACPECDLKHKEFNPLCGDRVTVYLNCRDQILTKLSFEGHGCAIMMASASVMTDVCSDKSKAEALSFKEQLESVMYNNSAVTLEGDLEIFKGLSRFPARHKCLLLPWQALAAAIQA